MTISKKQQKYEFSKRKYKSYEHRPMGTAVAPQRWTPTAVQCYLRGCNCEGCYYSEFFEQDKFLKKYSKVELEIRKTCQMKASVLELVRVFGLPTVEQIEEAKECAAYESNNRKNYIRLAYSSNNRGEFVADSSEERVENDI